jgi:hypothetical protein
MNQQQRAVIQHAIRVFQMIDDAMPFPVAKHAQQQLRQLLEQPEPVQEPVAHCEVGPEHCQQCHLEDRSLALAAAVRYVKNNTPKLVSDEICRAVTTPPAQPAVPLTTAQIHAMMDNRNAVDLNYRQGVRDAEAHHGITTSPTQGEPK